MDSRIRQAAMPGLETLLQTGRMKITTILCRLALVLSLSIVGAGAATYYVATTGSDANPGTAAQPFRTITYAYSHASAGTTILVAPGTYTDYTSGWGLHLNASGTAASPIVLQSQVRGGAILDGQFASDRHDGIYLDGSYNVIAGFVITRAPITGVFVAGNANQILDDEIATNGTQGASDPEGQGIYSVENSSGNLYDGNYIHDNGYAGSNLDHGLTSAKPGAGGRPKKRVRHRRINRRHAGDIYHHHLGPIVPDAAAGPAANQSRR
jgi:hypothetical protein